MNEIKNKNIVSGITSTGSLTIGNYLGAIKNFLNLQEKNNLFIFVADLHALTIDNDPDELNRNKKEIFALYLSCGLDMNKTSIFFQSDNHDHLLLNWIATCNTNMGELSRMTQFKDKSSKINSKNNSSFIPTGLFVYPSLMAADILLYNADYVPVGIDQKQHLELTQKLAKRLNHKFDLSLKEPQGLYVKTGAKIMSLVEPTKKMSKSDKNKKASIFLLDDPEVAYKKIMSAKTDSENKVYLSDQKPGIKNLLSIYAALKNIGLLEAEKNFLNLDYKTFKEEVALVVKNFLINIQKEFKKNLNLVEEKAKIGLARAQAISHPQIKNIYKKIGL